MLDTNLRLNKGNAVTKFSRDQILNICGITEMPTDSSNLNRFPESFELVVQIYTGRR